MMCSENLIPLVYARPEIWDQSHVNYTSKKLKVRSWMSIAEKLKVTTDVAKARWTNLRDLFRRELKKTLKMAEETGDPNAHKPRWKHFKNMLFLKDQIIKDEGANSLHIEDSFSLYPQTILEDGEDEFHYEEDGLVEIDSSHDSSTTHQDVVSNQSRKRISTEHFQSPAFGSNKRVKLEPMSDNMGRVSNGEDYGAQSVTDVDEDFHFVMSILPSMRRIRQERKTNFKMKILQLIMDEEKEETA